MIAAAATLFETDPAFFACTQARLRVFIWHGLRINRDDSQVIICLIRSSALCRMLLKKKYTQSEANNYGHRSDQTRNEMLPTQRSTSVRRIDS